MNKLFQRLVSVIVLVVVPLSFVTENFVVKAEPYLSNSSRFIVREGPVDMSSSVDDSSHGPRWKNQLFLLPSVDYSAYVQQEQPPIDRTLENPEQHWIPFLPNDGGFQEDKSEPVADPLAFGSILDDFNRPDGSLGEAWTVKDGYCGIAGYAAYCGDTGIASYDADSDGNSAEIDVLGNGSSVQYAGLVLNYGAGISNVFVKVQKNYGHDFFDTAACYIGNNSSGGSFGLNFFSLSEGFYSAHLKAYRVGDRVTIHLSNIDNGSKVDQIYVCDGAPAPEGTAVGIAGFQGITRIDNFAMDGSIPPSLPFQPNPDGYSFQNWGSISYSDYTYSDLVRMFGAEAACWSAGPVCILKPYAELFNWTANLSMNGGHCLGMSVTSSRFYKGADLHTGFDGTFDMSKESTVTVNWLSTAFSSTARRNISYFHVMQSTEPIASRISENMQKTPSEFLSELSTFMDNPGNDYPVLVFYDNTMNGGHAVTPYAIEGQGDGVFYVKIYDNNFPDNFERKITINELENTWSYYDNYQGNAGSHNLAFVPISLFAQRPQCPWCENTLNSISLMQLNYDGSGELLITDSLGNRLGFQAGVFYNEIPGAFANPQFGGLEIDSQPIFYLPVSGEYDITIDGAMTDAPDMGSLVTYGPGFAVQIAGITTAPSTFDEISISSNGTSFAYQPNQAQQVDVGLFIDTDTASWQLQTGQVDVAAGQTGLIMVDPAQKTLVVNNLQNAAGDYNLFFKSVSDNGTALYASNAISLPEAVTHSIHFDGWQESGILQLDKDTDGDGIPEETIFLENQMKYLFLPLAFR